MRWSFATIVLVPRGQSFAPPTSTERRRIFAWARESGFTGIELHDAWLDFPRHDARALREVKIEIADAGLQVSALNLSRCLFTRGPQAERQYARVERALDTAATLSAEIVNLSLSLPLPFGAVSARHPMIGSEAAPSEHDRAADRLAQLAARATPALKLAVELHDDGLLDTPALCLRLLRHINHPCVGLNPDVANICRGPGPVADWRQALKLLAPHTTHWHVKNYRNSKPAPLPDGDIDYAVACEIMRHAGYDGWVGIESRFGDMLAEQRAALVFLKSLSAMRTLPPSR